MMKADIPQKQQSHVATDPRLTLRPQHTQCLSSVPSSADPTPRLAFLIFSYRYEHLSRVETFCISSGAQKLLCIVKYFFSSNFSESQCWDAWFVWLPLLDSRLESFQPRWDVADYQTEDRKNCWKGRFSSRFNKDGDEYNLGQDRHQHWWMNWILMMMVS